MTHKSCIPVIPHCTCRQLDRLESLFSLAALTAYLLEEDFVNLVCFRNWDLWVVYFSTFYFTLTVAWLASVSVHHVHVWCPQRTEGVRSLGTGVTQRCKLPSEPEPELWTLHLQQHIDSERGCSEPSHPTLSCRLKSQFLARSAVVTEFRNATTMRLGEWLSDKSMRCFSRGSGLGIQNPHGSSQLPAPVPEAHSPSALPEHCTQVLHFQ